MSDEMNPEHQTLSEKPDNTTVAIKKHSKKLLLLGIAAIAIIAAVVLLLLQPSKHNDKRQLVPATNIGAKRPLTVSEQAEKINRLGDYNAAQKLLDVNITSSKTSKERGVLYETKSLMALNAKKYAETLDFAKKADSLSPTRTSAILAAQGAEGLGDQANAIQYYQKASSYLDETKRKKDENAELDYQSYQKKIKQLGGN